MSDLPRTDDVRPEPPAAPRRDFSDWAPVITLGVLVLFFGMLTQNFFSLNTLENVLKQGSVLAIVSVGLTFVLLCGEIDLSVGMVALWTACLCGVMWESSWVAGPGGKQHAAVGWPTLLAVLVIPLLTSLAFGLLSGTLTVLSRLPSFIITLSMMNIAVGLARYLTRSEKFAPPKLLIDV
ncbi:MAG: ABC transporter permease, partial [Planctomycetaceae bacterium]